MTDADKLKYEISAAELLDLKTARDLYTAVISAPRDQRVIRKAATESLPGLFKDAEEIVDDRLTNLIVNYQVSDPEFYAQFNNALIPINFNRYTAIGGEIIDAESGEDLSKVKITITSSEKTYEEMSNHHGNYIKLQLDPNIDYDMKFELPGYEVLNEKVKDLKLGKHKVVNVELRKKTV